MSRSRYYPGRRRSRDSWYAPRELQRRPEPVDDCRDCMEQLPDGSLVMDYCRPHYDARPGRVMSKAMRNRLFWERRSSSPKWRAHAYSCGCVARLNIHTNQAELLRMTTCSRQHTAPHGFVFIR